MTETLIVAHADENSGDNGTAFEDLSISFKNECSIECNLCGKKFSLNCQQQHECPAASSTQEEHFKCVTCSETFLNILALHAHQQSHSEKKSRESTNLDDKAAMVVQNQVLLRDHCPRKLCNRNILKMEARKQSQKGTALEDKTDAKCLHKKARSKRRYPRKLYHKAFTYTNTLQVGGNVSLKYWQVMLLFFKPSQCL